MSFSRIIWWFLQISNLTQSVASMETQLRQQIEQRHRAEADLMAVRDLCVKLDQQKDTLVEELGDKDTVKAHVNLLTLHSIHLFFILLLFYFLHVILVSPSLYFFLIQYEAQLSRLKAEQSIVQDQITRDRVTIERLETLLDQSRQESINAQATNQELQNEISRLKQKVSELQNKLYVPLSFRLFSCYILHLYIFVWLQFVRIRGTSTVSESSGGIQQTDQRAP